MAVAWINRVWEHSQQKGSKLLLLLAIADNADDSTGTAWPGMDYLARKTRMSKRSCQYGVREIEADGELKIYPGKGPHGTNLYEITLPDGPGTLTKKAPKEGAKFAPPAPEEGCKPAPQGVQPSAKGGAIAVAPEPLVNRQELTHPLPPTDDDPVPTAVGGAGDDFEHDISPTGPETDAGGSDAPNPAHGGMSPPEDEPEKPAPRVYPADFERFWQAYPRGYGNKLRTFKVWKGMKPTEALQVEILAGLERWKKCDRWRRKKIIDAATWLRDEWWWDETPDDTPEPPTPSLNSPAHRGHFVG